MPREVDYSFNILYVIYTNLTHNINIYYCCQDNFNYCTVVCHGETISMDNQIWFCSKRLLYDAIVEYNLWFNKWCHFYNFINYFYCKDIVTHMLSSYYILLNN
jgi:hypothetical protein